MRLQEIQTRKNEIKELLLGSAEINLDEIETELAALEAEERSIQQRQETAAKINAGEVQTRKINNEEETVTEMNTNSIEYRKAFMAYVTRGTAIPMELRSDENTKTTDIGALIPEVVIEKIIEKIGNYGMIMPLITKTSYKAGVSIPTSTVKPVATWVGEGEGSDRQKKTLAGSITFGAYKLRCAVSVSLEVDTLALPVFEATLINNVAEAMATAIENAVFNGTGVGAPKGILKETPVAGQAVDAVPGFAALIAAEAALPQQYENGAVYAMTKKSFMAFVGEVDDNGQPIARVNYGINGRPERFLLGRPVICNDYIDSYAVGLVDGTPWAVLFNFSDYILNTAYSVGIKTYEDNETDDIVSKAIMLADGKAIDLNSLVVLTK